MVALRKGEALSINYPPLPLTEVEGRAPGGARVCSASYEQVRPGVFVSSPVRPAAMSPAPHVLFYRGFVTIVPIDGGYTADADVFPRIAVCPRCGPRS